MRKQLLLSTAALLAGVAMASAQSMPGGHSQAGSMGAEHQQSAQSHSGQSTHEPNAQRSEQRSGRETTGQAQNQGQRSEQQGQREHTTGQAAGEKAKSSSQAESSRTQQGAQRERTTGQGGAANKAEHRTGQEGRPESATSANPNQAEHGNQGQAARGQGATSTNRNPREQTTTGQSERNLNQAPSTGQSERNLNQAPSTAQSGRNGMQGAATQNHTQQSMPQGQEQSRQSMGQSQQGGTQTRQAQGVSLTPQQQTRIHETVFAGNNVPRAENVNFAVSVGTTVPSTVRVIAVPETLVEIYPQWRGDEYFVVRDEVVIVDHSRRIVAVVPTGSSTASSYSSETHGSSAAVNLSRDEIRQLQVTLNQKGFNVGEPDGVFGARTREALIQFQQREGLQRTGQFDQRTMSALGINAGGQRGAQGSQTQPSSTGQAGTASNPSAGTGMNNGGTSPKMSQPSTSGQSGTSGNTMSHPSPMPGAAGANNPNSGSSGTGHSTANPSGGSSSGGAGR